MLYDFVTKLRKDPLRLEVLGDGTQTKSYLHVDDCVDAFLMALEDNFWTRPTEVYNIGSEDQTNVLRIARVVTDAMGLQNVSISVSAGPGGRTWPGDVGTMQLDVSKIKGCGWNPKRNSDEAIRTAATELVRDIHK